MVKFRISRKNQRIIKFVTPVAAAVAVFALVLANTFTAQAAQFHKKYQFIDTNYAVPASNVAWIAPNGNDQTGNGTEGNPYATFQRGLRAVSDGGTVVAKSGIYREPHFFVTKKNITFQAAPHAEVWIKGSDEVAANRWTKEGSLWKTSGNFRNFCRVCTVNPNPELEGMAAYPEQVFINDQPLEQVKNKADVGPGKFYVEDKTPTTLKDPKNNRAGFNVGPQDELTYYLGSDPTAGRTEISNRARAFSVGGDASNFAMKAINIAQYSPVQEWRWDYKPANDEPGTSMIVVNGPNSLVENSIFAQSSSVGFNTDATNARIVNNKFIGNGGNGAGANRAHGTTFDGNTFAENNAANYITNGSICTAWCTVSELKVTHIDNFTFRNNIVDNSQNPSATSNDYYVRNGTAGIWCDEGCINAKIVNNFFINTTSAIVDEVSHGTIIASNIIEGAGAGISISGSSDIKVYNNSISRANRPIMLNEDSRTNGCNARRPDGSCQYPENWSIEKGLSWNLTGFEMYNNIVSSRAVIKGDSSGPLWSYPVRSTGNTNHTGPGVYTNDMFRGFDYNAYYRSSETDEPFLMTWDLAEVEHPLNILFKKASDVSKDSRVRSTIEGRDTHSLDLFGSRADNPYFIKEANGNTDFRQSNYNLKPGSPAINSGKPLPAAVAQAIDPSGQTVRAGVAVNRGALMNVMMDATNGTTPTPPVQPPAVTGVEIPDNRLRQILNQNLARSTGSSRADDQAITAEEMSRITAIYADNTNQAAADQRVKNLKGLEHATNLTTLSLGNHAISDLNPIAGLGKIEVLQLFGNKISNIQPLARLSKLSNLNLSDNTVTDLGPVSQLTNLKQVSLSSANMTLDLRAFAASKNTIERIAYYDYERTTKVTGIDTLIGAPKLNTLRLSGASVTPADLAKIGQITTLQSLRLDHSTITDLSPLAGLSKLTRLDVSSQHVGMQATTESFSSPLKDPQGAFVEVTNSGSLLNDTNGKLKLAHPVYDNQPHEARANWNKQVTIGGITTAFSGELIVTATLPMKTVDKATLRAAIAAAEAEPGYIKSDTAVATALARAKQVLAQSDASESDVQAATDALNRAVAAAKKKESDAQAAAEQAVSRAETSKDPDDVTAAAAKVNEVQDPAKKQSLSQRLSRVTGEIEQARQALTALIARAKDEATTRGMSQETKDALAEQVRKAEQANTPGASVAELTTAKNELQAKIDGLRADVSALRGQIATAEAAPDYIKTDPAVVQALSRAKQIVSAQNPSVTDIAAAVDALKKALAAAEQKELDAQTDAETAVAMAEASKDPDDVNAAKQKVEAVQNPAKKSALQDRLNAITAEIAKARDNLNNLIAHAKKPETTNGMSQDSKDALTAAVAKAEQVAHAVGSSVAELTSAREALQSKIDALRGDTAALQAAITAAESAPAYVTSDLAVAAALQQAKAVLAKQRPAPAEIEAATDALNEAVAAVKRQEMQAQAAAEAAVLKAEADKTQQAIDAAKPVVAQVKDDVKRKALEDRLAAIVIPPAPGAPTTKATVRQQHGRPVTIETAGDTCYNLTAAHISPVPARHNSRVLRDTAAFVVNCANQAPASGFTARVTITLSQRYADTARLTVAKIAKGAFQQDITNQVTFGTSADGQFTTIAYEITDGGFGDEDGAVNGAIADPVAVYEEEAATPAPQPGQTNPINTAVREAAALLADTGNNIIALIMGAVTIIGAGAWLIVKRR